MSRAREKGVGRVSAAGFALFTVALLYAPWVLLGFGVVALVERRWLFGAVLVIGAGLLYVGIQKGMQAFVRWAESRPQRNAGGTADNRSDRG